MSRARSESVGQSRRCLRYPWTSYQFVYAAQDALPAFLTVGRITNPGMQWGTCVYVFYGGLPEYWLGRGVFR